MTVAWQRFGQSVFASVHTVFSTQTHMGTHVIAHSSTLSLMLTKTDAVILQQRQDDMSLSNLMSAIVKHIMKNHGIRWR